MVKLLVASLLISVSSIAAADPKATSCPEPDKQEHTISVEIIDGKAVTVIKGDFIICHHLPRPGVVVVTTPKTIDYAWESLEQKVLPHVLATVKKAPF